jgi:hypothetical protein
MTCPERGRREHSDPRRRGRWLSVGVLILVLLAVVGVACASQPAPPAPSPEPEAAVAFAEGAFPPPIPDIEQHQGSWLITDCIKCHSEEAGEATTVKHEGMPEVLLQVNCRTCHVFISEQTVEVSQR